MSMQDQAPGDHNLLRDLLDGLEGRGSGMERSIGIVGSGHCASQPPAHCMRACLNNDPNAVEQLGCSLLRRAARNDEALANEAGACCDRGYRVAARTTMVGGEPGTIVTVEAMGETPVEPAAELDLLGCLDQTSQLVQRVDQLMEENAGFADEVLQNYEQLNMIFDLTQQVFQVTEPLEIERLLMNRLARMLSSDAVYVMTHDDICRAYDAAAGARQVPMDDGAPLPDFDLAVDYVRRTRQIHVRLAGRQRVIAGPLVRLDNGVDVVLAIRRASQNDFHSGEMMLIESILAFGGQIISNAELHERLRKMSLEVTRAMVAAIDKKDHYTSGHSERVGFLTRLIAAEMGVSVAEQETMEWAGLLHDVGKIGIPEEILCKPGKLTFEEFETIKGHPRMGYEILKPIASLGVILDGVLHHHEYPDGSGYPKGLKGDEIPLVARIIHVADTFDALTSTRSYRKAFTTDRAYEIIREDSGTRIDADVAEAFFRAFERYRDERPQDYNERFVRQHEAYATKEENAVS